MAEEGGGVMISGDAPQSTAMGFLLHMLRQLEAERFFGGLEVKFEAGRVVIIRKIETFKPVGRDARDSHEQTTPK
jgi:hypothetical protein